VNPAIAAYLASVKASLVPRPPTSAEERERAALIDEIWALLTLNGEPTQADLEEFLAMYAGGRGRCW
jgi:hypothetical protein